MANEKKRTRKNRKFPLEPFSICYDFAKKLNSFGAGNKVRRISLFDHLNKSPDSGSTRNLITNCSKYGLTQGSYAADFLELTPKAKLLTSENTPAQERKKLEIEIAILDHDIYNQIYEKFNGNKLPSLQVIIDFVKEILEETDDSEVAKIVNIFTKNAEDLELIKTIAGAQRLIKIGHALESASGGIVTSNEEESEETRSLVIIESTIGVESYREIEDVCFYITPIGEEGSEHRKHADLFLESIIQPALEKLNLKVVRADKISKPGTITKQIIENIIKAKLVIADLSFHNPNVFYELALRHAVRLPTVQLIRKADKIPFDLSHYRTIVIDTTDIYSLVPKLDFYKNEVAVQVEEVLKDPDSVDNPIINVFPNLKIKI